VNIITTRLQNHSSNGKPNNERKTKEYICSRFWVYLLVTFGWTRKQLSCALST